MRTAYICGILLLVFLSGCDVFFEDSNNETIEQKSIEELKEEYWEKREIQFREYSTNIDKFYLKEGDTEIVVFAICYDKVICYLSYNYDSGSCFRDQDLVERYCNYKLGEKEEKE